GEGPARGDLRRRGAARPRRGQGARGEGRCEQRGDRSAQPLASGLRYDRRVAAEDEPGARGLRGCSVLGLWRRDRREDRGRVLRMARGPGAWLLGRWADRHARPAALYGGLEIAIGVFGLVSPLVLSLAHRVYVAAAGAWQLSGAASVALRFGLAALVLLVPTTLMGGT